MLIDFLNSILPPYLAFIILLLYLLTVLSTAIMVIHEKRDPAKTSIWVLILILLPVLGLIFYIFFGQNHRKEKMFNRKEIKDLKHIELLSKTQLSDIKTDAFYTEPSIVDNLNIITLLLNNSKALLTIHNQVEIFQTGKKTFNAIIDNIDKAQESIHLVFYIIASDNIGNIIKEKLIKKARAGVEVRLIYDDVGSWKISKKFITELKEAGVEVYPFMKVKFPLLTSKFNYRNHRKVIVIDGKVAFMGGMNIADRYLKGDESLGMWYDTVLRIRGEAVKVLQLVFFVDWFFVSKKIVSDSNKYFPEHPVPEAHPVQITVSGPDSDWASIMQAFFAAITHAKKHIYISTPYFVPNQSILTALKTASLSGVDVRIVLPGKSDATVVYWSSMSYVSELLKAGIKVYLFQNGFNHSKILMIDTSFASVGSANMDIRSFEDNFEIMAMIYDPEVTQKLETQFLRDIKRSKKVNVSRWNRRPIRQTFKESVARMFSPLF
ncbi:MAG: cardiolipin synthase [Bacteroidales bacterium]|nr:cardiolipin synthase [Bacteroidales bacterium]MDD4672985.1 cardiolipin synthase [Bacteroidales bacterium]MDY0348502.1 cardiolipin synthase [Tenuifilaceae bacterium]